MNIKLAAIGAFLIVIGAFGISLSLATDAAVFQPVTPPILSLLAGGLLLIVGLLLP